jgi:hypothetical protein
LRAWVCLTSSKGASSLTYCSTWVVESAWPKSG